MKGYANPYCRQAREDARREARRLAAPVPVGAMTFGRARFLADKTRAERLGVNFTAFARLVYGDVTE